jgi:hypothetical protein
MVAAIKLELVAAFVGIRTYEPVSDVEMGPPPMKWPHQ